MSARFEEAVARLDQVPSRWFLLFRFARREHPWMTRRQAARWVRFTLRHRKLLARG